MRIAVINESFDPAEGGAERCALDLALALEGRGHAVTQIARDPDAGRLSGHRALERAAGAALTTFDRTVSLTRVAGHVLVPQGGVDAAAEAGSARFRGPIGRALAGLGRAISPKHAAFSRSEKRAVGGARRLVALSRMVRDDMVARWGVDPARVDVIPNGVDCDRFRPSGAEERGRARGRYALGTDETVLLLITHNWRLRGLEHLVAVLARIPGKMRLLLVGRDVPDEIATTARVRPLGPLEDPRPAFAAADLLVHPTFYDPCSLVTLEALACGLPVVTTRWNGAAELFSGPEGSVIDDPRDVGALAKAIESFSSVERRAAAGAAARATAERNTKAAALSRLCDVIEASGPDLAPPPGGTGKK